MGSERWASIGLSYRRFDAFWSVQWTGKWRETEGGALYLLRHVLRITHVHRGQPCAHDPRAGPKAMLSGSTTAPRSCHLEFSGTLARRSLSVHLPSGTDQDFRVCDSFADMWMCRSAEWTQITVGAEPAAFVQLLQEASAGRVTDTSENLAQGPAN